MERQNEREWIAQRETQLWEQYEEAFFATLMADFVNELGEDALRENELLSADPQAALPPDLQRRCLNTIQKQFRQQKISNRRLNPGPVVKRIAIAVMIVSVLFTTGFAVIPPFRRYVIQSVESTEFGAYGSKSGTPIYRVTADWLPNGYELVNESKTSISCTNLYRTEDGKELEIFVVDATKGGISVDTEAEVNDIIINGNPAVSIFKKGVDGYGEPYERSVVAWIDETRGWYIEVSSYDESVETMIQVSEAVIIK